ncbi:MAG: PilN domain-containing protein [Timaviella obliquedivisa GSE-PSE-MK23-08B]|jgi:type IV pilus assembly protein PilN|nr:PilN domain-containing protein [Timaviella obliquedivisa GSE-PSE-MK23-08B]
MYALDINFLNDRTERQSESPLKPKGPVNQTPFYLGLAVAIALPALALGAWALLQSQNGTLEQRQAALDSELAIIQTQQAEVDAITQRVKDYEDDNTALATVFDRIKPWSGILQDIRDRVPNGVQISLIEQLPPEEIPVTAPVTASPSPSPGASPSPGVPEVPVVAASPQPQRIRVTGRAKSFSEVNDFILTLQRSPFLTSEDTKLATSKLIENPTKISFEAEEGQTASSDQVEVKFPPVVEYTIDTTLTELPASALLQDLERTLSVGLASRIQALRDRGVLKP